MDKSCYFVKPHTGYCSLLYCALKLEKSLKNDQKKYRISLNVHREKDTNGLASAHGLRGSALLCPKSWSHSCTFALLSNRMGLEQHKYKQFNSKDDQKICQHLIMEFIQKNFSAKIFLEDRWTDGMRVTHTRLCRVGCCTHIYTPRRQLEHLVFCFNLNSSCSALSLKSRLIT